MSRIGWLDLSAIIVASPAGADRQRPPLGSGAAGDVDVLAVAIDEMHR